MKKAYGSDNLNGQNANGFDEELKFDIAGFNEEQLQALLDNETDLLFEGGANMALINACSARLAELRGDTLKTEKTTAAIITEAEEENKKDKGKTRRRIPKTKLIAVAAIIGATACLTTATLATPTHTSEARYYVVSNPVGTTVEIEEGEVDAVAHTIVHVPSSTRYASLEKLLAALEAEVYYPALFPNDEKPVNFLEGTVQNHRGFSVSLYNAKISFDIIIGYPFTEKDLDTKYFDVYEAHGIRFYFGKDRNSAIFFDSGNYYCITAQGAHSREDIIFVIDNLKKG